MYLQHKKENKKKNKKSVENVIEDHNNQFVLVAFREEIFRLKGIQLMKCTLRRR